MPDKSESEPSSVVLVYSGGMDSTVLLYRLLSRGVEVKGALTVDYGQKHRKEIEGAREICAELGVRHKLVDLRGLASLFGKSSLTDAMEAVPEGHYEEVSMKSTVVPNRNMILLSVATAWAISLEAEAVAYAAHGGDHAIYPDCREEFAEALGQAISICDWHAVRLYRPFVPLSKAELVRQGAELKVPFAQTWSCYKGGRLHCGRCGTCIERREAFYLAGIKDPTEYAADAPEVQTLADSNWKLA